MPPLVHAHVGPPARAKDGRSWTVTRGQIEAWGFERTPGEPLGVIEAKGREVAEALAPLRDKA